VNTGIVSKDLLPIFM